MLGKSEGRSRRWVIESKMVGWHHRLNGQESELTPGNSEGQGSLVCCSPWVAEKWTQLCDLTTIKIITEHLLCMKQQIGS